MESSAVLWKGLLSWVHTRTQKVIYKKILGNKKFVSNYFYIFASFFMRKRKLVLAFFCWVTKDKTITKQHKKWSYKYGSRKKNGFVTEQN